METLCYRFPHVASMIFKDLDDRSLIKILEANRELDNFLSNDRIYWIRVLAHYNTSFMQFQDSWRRSLHQVPAVKIKELAIAAQNFFEKQARLDFQWSPLHIVANKGNLELYEYISRKCGCINHVTATDTNGVTAIHMAAIAGHLEIVTFIIDNLPNHDQSAANGLTPLHCAAIMGRFETCKFIINLLANKNPRDNEGFTPLHSAAETGHIRIYKLIMEDLVDKNPGNNFGWTPLHTAAYFNQSKIVKFIIDHVQDKNPEDIDGFSPLQVAIELGHLEVAKLFLEHHDVQILFDDSYTLLHAAARYGDLELCKLLIENSKDKNCADRYGWTPLHYAAINGHVAIYELFSEYFGDNHHFNNVWTLGHFAAKNGTSRLEQENGRDLINLGPKTNDGTTPLKLMALNLSKSKEFITFTSTCDARDFTKQAGSWEGILGHPAKMRPLILSFATVRIFFGSHTCHRTVQELVAPYFSIVIHQLIHQLVHMF